MFGIRERSLLERRLKRDRTPWGILRRWAGVRRAQRQFPFGRRKRDAECEAACVVLLWTDPTFWALGANREYLAERVSRDVGIDFQPGEWKEWTHWSDLRRSVRRAVKREHLRAARV